jgi:hypothetical protein
VRRPWKSTKSRLNGRSPCVRAGVRSRHRFAVRREVATHCVPLHTKLRPFCVCSLTCISRTFRYFWPGRLSRSIPIGVVPFARHCRTTGEVVGGEVGACSMPRTRTWFGGKLNQDRGSRPPLRLSQPARRRSVVHIGQKLKGSGRPRFSIPHAKGKAGFLFKTGP